MQGEGMPGLQIEEPEVLALLGDSLPECDPGKISGETGDVPRLQGLQKEYRCRRDERYSEGRK